DCACVLASDVDGSAAAVNGAGTDIDERIDFAGEPQRALGVPGDRDDLQGTGSGAARGDFIQGQGRQGPHRGSGAMVAGGFVDLSQGRDRAAGGNADDSRCADAAGTGGPSLCGSTGFIRALLVYRNTHS